MGALKILVSHRGYENNQALAKLDSTITDSLQVKNVVKYRCGHGIDSPFDLAVEIGIILPCPLFLCQALRYPFAG